MQNRFQRITPFLWFDTEAEEAVRTYTGIFEDSRIVTTTRYNANMAKAAGRPEGSVLTVAFELAGQLFTALNGGPLFTFNAAISLMVHCTSQKEVDHYWDHLAEGGDPEAQRCGWLKDRFGLSWQIVPSRLAELLNDPDPRRAQRASAAMFKMKKLDVKALEDAVA